MTRLSRLLAVFVCSFTAACTVGDVTDGQPGGGRSTDDPATEPGAPGTPGVPTPPGQTGISLSNPAAVSTKLGTTIEIPIAVSAAGVAGNIALTATGVPAGWTASVVPASVSGTEATEVHLVVQVPTNATASAYQLGVSASGSGASQAVVAPVTVQNQLDLSIASGGVHSFSGVVYVKAGAQLLIKNNDTVNHQVHASAPLQHQGSPMAPGGTYTQTPGGAGQVTVYCHIHGQGSGALNIIVQ
ncbi:MAG: hypothetical protein IPL79_05860 [Myxococcales bacterium]|nr:hypothetical protein [Myxococcales bacterium]